VTLTYSSAWRGGRWDVERLLADVFTFPENVSATWVDGLRVERMFTEVNGIEEHLAAGDGILWLHRRGGHLNALTQRDESIVELAIQTSSADASKTLASFVTSVLEAFGDEGGTVHRSTPHLSGLSTTFMVVPGEVVGPQLIPELIRDERWVPMTWQIHAERPKGLPDYRESLGLNDD
jgi:hypothetical protein